MDPTCSNIINGEVCGKPGWSLSVIHADQWRCLACYMEHLKNWVKLSAMQNLAVLLQNMNDDDKSALVRMIGVKK